MKSEYNIALKEKQLDEGLNREELNDLYDLVSGVDVIPIEIQGESSTAMGFINLTDAEYMDYDYTKLEEVVRSVLNDMDKENSDYEYEVENRHGVSTIYLSRDI